LCKIPVELLRSNAAFLMDSAQGARSQKPEARISAGVAKVRI
jgi:hypothetical protein